MAWKVPTSFLSLRAALLEPVLHSRLEVRMRFSTVEVLADKISDTAQLVEISTFAARYVCYVTVPNERSRIALKPKLDNEGVNFGLG